MPKYAPANDAGEKPYVVEYWNFGREKSRLVFASDRAAARYKVIGRDRHAYATRIRRALVEEVSSVPPD